MYKLIWVLFLTIFITSYSEIRSQTHNPKLWYLGYQSPLRDTNTIDTGYFLEAGSSVLDFRTSPMSQFRVGNTLSIGDCNAFIFNDKDSLILYSNGSKVFNGKHRLIEGADSLNYGAIAWANSPFTGNYYAEYYIRVFNQAITILPIPKQKNKYALISIFINGDEDTFHKITYSVIDMNLNNGLGKMTVKEFTVALGDFVESINAVRHGNGIDWWLITREYTTNNCYTIMLLDSSGIRVVSRNQCTGFDLKDRNANSSNTINRFSWDGKFYASFTNKGIELYDFNRCNGTLSNRREIKIPDTITSYMGGGVFSPNNKILYVNNYKNLYQVELSSFNVTKVAVWDGFLDSAHYPYTTGFNVSQLASDGKIYFATTAFTHYLHRIDNPNIFGVGCNVVQRAVKIQTMNSGIPHYPNFELGADTCWHSAIQEAERVNVNVFPNPADAHINILSDSHFEYLIEIYNSIGQKVLSSNENKVNVAKLDIGFYIVRILNKEGIEISNKKLIINR